MTQYLKGRALPAAVLSAAAAVVLLLAAKTCPAVFPTPETLSGMDPEAAEAALAGQTRRDILDAWGEPDGTLSGLFGDIYNVEEGVGVIIYYDTESVNQGAAGSDTVPVWSVSLYHSPASLGAIPYLPSS